MKGVFTQCFVLLLQHKTSFDKIISALENDYDILHFEESVENWSLSGRRLQIEYDKASNGRVQIDYVERTWPDEMGSEKEPELLSAWSTGHFGPFAYPHGLQRAAQQAWRLPEKQREWPRHASFLRLRLSYVFGSERDAPVRPDNYNAFAELNFLNRLTQQLLSKIPNALFFNPNGEVLLTKKLFNQSLEFSNKSELPTFDLWSNIRLYKIDDSWLFMDSVGNLQLDLPDVEVIVPSSELDLKAIDNFIKTVTLYLNTHGQIIKHGETIDGPNDLPWQAFLFETALCDPPRNTIRFFPPNRNDFPSAVMPGESSKKKKSWWKF